MTDTPLKVRRPADDREIAAVADLVARSFDHLAANRYLVSDPAERLPRMREFFRIGTDHAAKGHGEVVFTEDLTGAAVWFDRTRPPAEPADYEQRLAAAGGDHLPRFHELDELLEGHHPEEPHWHLAFLAVDPANWGQGIGGSLMRHTLDRLDLDGVPAYLEATNDDNRRLYRSHGFHDLTPAEIHLGDGTPFYRMWRPAGAASA
jgi:ribosomal protein S18 acetylase RimI-like enzyme